MVRRFLTLSLTICAALGLPMRPAAAQQTGGILKFFHRDSPASMSIHEEATISTVAPMMGVFNNLVLFKQDEIQRGVWPRRKTVRCVSRFTLLRYRKMINTTDSLEFRQMDSSPVATGTITALLATARVYLSHWALAGARPGDGVRSRRSCRSRPLMPSMSPLWRREDGKTIAGATNVGARCD
jgi:hypothetical protein